ncbi:MAG: response regulator transcription factor [Coriobacteriales bacterium]|nr:response regulator transcription factor [Coriobacteriales bacterium]
MRVLVVEDEERIREYLATHLRKQGYAVDCAADGEAALQLARQVSYDVVTLDILLPKVNGYEVCRILRDEGATVPILMLTAKDGEYDEADALDMGADDFLRKPFSLVVLDARLRSLIRRRVGERTKTLVAGDLALDPRTRKVVRAGEVISLTPREYALLEYLMYGKGRVFSKDQILEHVWGRDHPLSDNVVEVYVGYVRKKVDASHANKLIETVRGVGYRMRDV